MECQKGWIKRLSEIFPMVWHIERMGNDRTGKSVYVGEFVGSRLVGRPLKMWVDSVKDNPHV